MIKGIIYDMDGVLIDSEPLWYKSMIKCAANADIELTLEECKKTTGIRIDEIIDIYYERWPWDLEKYSRETFENDITDSLIADIHESGTPMEGVYESLGIFEKLNLPVSLASSSCLRIIDAVTTKLKIKDRFSVIHSGELEKYGKPHPSIYMTTAEKMGINPSFCLAIEDSVNGLISAKAAKMKCISIPAPEDREDRRFHMADITLNSLSEITAATIEKSNF